MGYKALEVLETGPATGSNKSRHCIQGILRTVNTLTGRRLVDKKLATASYKGEETFAITNAARELVRAAADAEKRAKRRLTCAFCWSATRHAKWCKRPAGTSGH